MQLYGNVNVRVGGVMWSCKLETCNAICELGEWWGWKCERSEVKKRKREKRKEMQIANVWHLLNFS